MVIKSECEEATSVSRVKVEEIGRKVVFINEENNVYKKIRFDGCVLVNKTSADWVVLRDEIGYVIIELKGRDVEHGLKQVIETAKYIKDEGLLGGRAAGIIVCQQVPRISTTIQRAKVAFKKICNGSLHIVARNREYNFADVLKSR